MFVCALFSSECCPTFSVATKLLQIEIYLNESNAFLKEFHSIFIPFWRMACASFFDKPSSISFFNRCSYSPLWKFYLYNAHCQPAERKRGYFVYTTQGMGWGAGASRRSEEVSFQIYIQMVEKFRDFFAEIKTQIS